MLSDVFVTTQIAIYCDPNHSFWTASDPTSVTNEL